VLAEKVRPDLECFCEVFYLLPEIFVLQGAPPANALPMNAGYFYPMRLELWGDLPKPVDSAPSYRSLALHGEEGLWE
jgi:hypothetical protein